MIGAGVNQGTTSPGELNFAFCGELAAHGGTLSGSMPLCLGQGSNHDDGESNNWWVGGTGWQAPHVDSDAAVEMLLEYALGHVSDGAPHVHAQRQSSPPAPPSTGTR